MPTTRQPHYLDKIKREVTIEKIQEELLESEAINPPSADIIMILEKTNTCFGFNQQKRRMKSEQQTSAEKPDN